MAGREIWPGDRREGARRLPRAVGADQAIPGAATGLRPGYAGKVEFVRRLWTSAFTTEVTDVFLVECDDMLDAHNYVQDLTRLLAKGGDPDRFGTDVKIWAGVNPDA